MLVNVARARDTGGMESEGQSEPSATPLPKRRWFQYSISTLLAIAILAVMLRLVVVPAERQRSAVAAIKNLGGDVMYDFQDSPTEFDAVRPAPDWLIDYVADVTVVELSHSKVTDQHMSLLRAFPEIERFRISAFDKPGLEPVNVTDTAIELLASFPKLKKVDLSGTRVSAKGIVQLKAALPGCDTNWDYPY